MRRIALSAAFALASTVQTAAAQQPPVPLGRPEAVLADAFSSLRGARELSGGRLLLADWIEERVVLVDLDAGTVTDVMRTGPGPDEVRLPSALIPMAGDSTLVVDLGNSRLTVLSPSGMAVRSIRAERPGMTGVRGVDARGGLWYAVPAWASGADPLPDDSVRVVRHAPDGTPRAVAVVQGSRMRSDAGSPSREPRIPVVGYAAQDAWTLLPGGAMAIVRGGQYRVEVVAADGRRTVGPPNAGRPRPVTDEDKRRFVVDFMASSPTSGRGAGGGLGHSPAPDESEVARFVRTTQFAEVHPWFEGSPTAAPGDRVWVRRAGPPGEPVLYDVFGADGRRLRTFSLPAGRRILTVGARGVYAAYADELGLESVERYRLPPEAVPTSNGVAPASLGPAAAMADAATTPRVSRRSTAVTASSSMSGRTSGR